MASEQDNQLTVPPASEPAPGTQEERAPEDAPAPAEGAAANEAAGGETSPQREGMEWYVVHTFSGYENSVKKNLEMALKGSPIADQFGEILVPMEEVTERRGTKTRRTKRKFFPGYIFVQMVMTKASWHLVTNTSRVTGFLGGRNPRPVKAAEMQRMLGQGEGEAEAAAAVEYKVGDKVRVKSGAFANFVGEVEEVNADKRKIWLSVSIFGRPTRVEVDFSEVEPAAG